MLKELYIENLAVISSASIPLEEGFNVFTGETGAGKSILIYGIQAVLGQRTSKDLVRTGAKKALIQAVFTPLSPQTRAILQENDLPDEDDLILSREISSDGGSTGKVNGKPAPAALLRALGETLVDIHGQHDSQMLLRPERHLEILDRFGDDMSLLDEYKAAFSELQSIARRLNQLRKTETEKLTRMQNLQRTIAEISQLDPQPNEDEILEKQFRAATAAEDIADDAFTLCQTLTEGEGDISDTLAQACETLRHLSRKDETAEPLLERLQAVNEEVRDISDEVGHYMSGRLSPSEMERLNDRRNAVNTLALRYNTDANGLRQILLDAQRDTEAISADTATLKELTDKRQAQLHHVTELAKKLSEYRGHLANAFSEQVGRELSELNMPYVKLSVILKQGKLTPTGMDNAEFLISANPGEPLKPIAQIASGGELSRLMLALKSVLAARDETPTLIFDEIDTGVSGKAAQKIGLKLKELATHHQVICVTHLAQLATQANHHLLIEKHSTETETNTEVTVLSGEQRVLEIARIMGGESDSELLMRTASEALDAANRE